MYITVNISFLQGFMNKSKFWAFDLQGNTWVFAGVFCGF